MQALFDDLENEIREKEAFVLKQNQRMEEMK